MMRRSNRPPMRSVRDELSSAWDAPSAPAAPGLTNKPTPKPMPLGPMQGGQMRPPAFGGAPPPSAPGNMYGLPFQQAARQAMAQQLPAQNMGGEAGEAGFGMGMPPPNPQAMQGQAQAMQSAMGQMPGMSMPTRPGPGAPPGGMNGGVPPPNPQAMQGQAQAMQGAMGQMQPPGAPPAPQPGEMAQLVQQAKQGAMGGMSAPPAQQALPPMQPDQRQAMANSLRSPMMFK